MASLKSRRRFFRFSLKSLFVMTLISAPLIGWFSNAIHVRNNELAELSRVASLRGSEFSIERNGELEAIQFIPT